MRGVETRSETNSREELEQKQVVPVTLALKPKDALAVTYADSFAGLGAAGRAPAGRQRQEPIAKRTR